MTRAWRRAALGGAVAVLAIGALLASVYWPHSSPTMIHLKSQLLGPEFVFTALWTYHDRWRTVVSGVMAGDPGYLRAAVELYPALDGEAAHDMVYAVSKVIECNPEGAISTLLPRYGAETVCGFSGMDPEFSPELVIRRLRAVQAYAASAKSTPELDACLRAAEATAAIDE